MNLIYASILLIIGSCLPKTPVTREDINTNDNSTPLPSFFEVQWSSFRVCDPLLTYRQSASPPPPTSKSGESPNTKNLGLLSPETPAFDATLHPDLILDNSTYEPSNIDSRAPIFNDESEVAHELWQV